MKLLMHWTWSVTGTENDGSDETHLTRQFSKFPHVASQAPASLAGHRLSSWTTLKWWRRRHRFVTARQRWCHHVALAEKVFLEQERLCQEFSSCGVSNMIFALRHCCCSTCQSKRLALQSDDRRGAMPVCFSSTFCLAVALPLPRQENTTPGKVLGHGLRHALEIWQALLVTGLDHISTM